MPLSPIRVLGLGNVLMGDDAFGPWVIEELLARWEFPEEVTVLDVGTPGLDLTPYLADAIAVLIVDTVRSGAPPGEIRIYTKQQLLALPPQPRLSPHDPGLADALFALEFAGSAPADIVVIGVSPGPVSPAIGLSPSVSKAVATAADEVVDRLVFLGFAPTPRAGGPAAPWWEKPAAAAGGRDESRPFQPLPAR